MHEWVMNIHYQAWIAQGRFISKSRTPSKQWGMCDNYYKMAQYIAYNIEVTRLDFWLGATKEPHTLLSQASYKADFLRTLANINVF